MSIKTQTKNKTKEVAKKLRRVKERQYWSTRDLSITIVGLFLISLMIAVVISSENIAKNERLLPHTNVAGVDLGDLNKKEAQEKLDQAVKDFLADKFVFTYQDKKTKKEFTAQADDLGLSIDTTDSIDRALALGHANNFFSNFKAQLLASSTGFETPLAYHLDDLSQKAFLDTAFLDIETPARQATLIYQNGQPREVPAKAGLEVDREQLVKDLLPQIQNLDARPINLKLVKTNPTITVNDLATIKKLAEQALNSNFTFSYDDQIFKPSKDDLGNWLEFYSVLPKNVLGKSICDCGLPVEISSKNDQAQQVPSLLITPFDQERLGLAKSDPYYVMVPPENFTEQSFNKDKLLPVFGFNRDKVNHWLLENVSATIDRPGQNARLAFVGGKVKVTAPSINGIEVDVEKAARDLVFNIASRTTSPKAKLQLAESKPAINEQIISKLGINTLIGRGVSDFSGSPPNRVHNINTGFEKYSGLVIAPKEEFSVVEKLGPVDAAAGFLPELVIVGKKITPQYGGGLCQVSTTIFRAALDAGFPITERTNHSFAVSYYKWPYPEWGVEATIYDPAPDLKFRNNTDHYILIQAYTKGGKAYVDFYGTDPKRTTTIEGPWRLSGSMAGGGTTTFNYIVRDAADKVIHKQTFVSAFQPFKNFKHE